MRVINVLTPLPILYGISELLDQRGTEQANQQYEASSSDRQTIYFYWKNNKSKNSGVDRAWVLLIDQLTDIYSTKHSSAK